MKIITTSKLFRLNWRDYLKAFLIAVGTPVALAIQSNFDNGTIPNWKLLAMAAVGGAVTYLLKNFLTPAKEVKPVSKNEIEYPEH